MARNTGVAGGCVVEAGLEGGALAIEVEDMGGAPGADEVDGPDVDVLEIGERELDVGGFAVAGAVESAQAQDGEDDEDGAEDGPNEGGDDEASAHAARMIAVRVALLA